MEIEYIAQHMASDFILAEDKQDTFDEIIQRISSLVYEDGTPVGNEVKLQVIDLISEFLAGKRIWKYKYGGRIVQPKKTDNQQFLLMVDHLINNLKNS
jgi:hypothetical protein